MESQNWMGRAIELAKQGMGWTNPNPLVGAVIVKDGRVIGEGYHACCGQAHAERNALAACTEDTQGAWVYVTLEPCCHSGRTPPCTEALIQAKVSKVFVGSSDPNPLVAGKGIAQLRAHGIEVVEHVMKKECDALNQIFFHYISTGTPFVALKYAMTADGKIATENGLSKWITGVKARAHVQELRNRYQAIMVGSETVLRDDPLLNCRMEGGKDPIRIICDGRLRIPFDSQICRTAGEIPTMIAAHQPETAKREALEKLGIRVLDLPLMDGRLDLAALFARLGQEKIDSVLVEGGSQLLGSLLERRLCQKLYCYIAPKLFGGAKSKTPVGGAGVSSPAEAIQLTAPQLTTFEGGDILLDYDVKEGG